MASASRYMGYIRPHETMFPPESTMRTDREYAMEAQPPRVALMAQTDGVASTSPAAGGSDSNKVNLLITDLERKQFHI